MLTKLHKKYNKGDLVLRDYLAAHRTILANDRTWLGYMRTALTLFVAGVTFIKFFDNKILLVIGWIFVPIGILLLIIGFWKYQKVRRMIHSIKEGGGDISNI